LAQPTPPTPQDVEAYAEVGEELLPKLLPAHLPEPNLSVACDIVTLKPLPTAVAPLAATKLIWQIFFSQQEIRENFDNSKNLR